MKISGTLIVMEVIVSCGPSVNKESERAPECCSNAPETVVKDESDESNSNMRCMKRVGFKVLLEHLDLKRNMIQ